MNKTEVMIRTALLKKRMTISELAKEMNVSQPSLSRKLKSNNFTESDFRLVAEILGLKLELNFVFDDGDKI